MIEEIVDVVCDLVGHPLEVEPDPERVPPDSREVTGLLSNPERAREAMGWTPSVDIREGLRHTIACSSEHHPERCRADPYVI